MDKYTGEKRYYHSHLERGDGLVVCNDNDRQWTSMNDDHGFSVMSVWTAANA